MATFNEKIKKIILRIKEMFLPVVPFREEEMVNFVTPVEESSDICEATTVVYPETDTPTSVENIVEGFEPCDISEEVIIDVFSPEYTYTVGEAIDSYISVKEAELKPSTIKGYKNIREHYFPNLMGLDVNYVDQSHLQAAIDVEIMEGRSRKSVQNAMTLLRNSMKKAYDDRKLLDDPTIFDVTIPKEQK